MTLRAQCTAKNKNPPRGGLSEIRLGARSGDCESNGYPLPTSAKTLGKLTLCAKWTLGLSTARYMAQANAMQAAKEANHQIASQYIFRPVTMYPTRKLAPVIGLWIR
jgi:hypothetical protein